MTHHKKAYSSYPFDDAANKIYHGYSASVEDYVLENVFQRFGNMNDLTAPASAEAKSLLGIVDPFTYRDTLTMPKLILNSTGDQFFLPDSSQFYWSQMLGEKYLMYAPNTDHSLSSTLGFDSATIGTLQAFYIAQVRNTNSIASDDVSVPKYSWRYENNTEKTKARIVVTSETPPKSVKLWQATNASHRDFRLETLGSKWTGTVLKSQCELDCEVSASPTCTCDADAPNQVFVGEVDIPQGGAGWCGFMVQLVYPGPDPSLEDVDFTFTTPVRVVPDVYPTR